jgi:hypothetical protein
VYTFAGTGTAGFLDGQRLAAQFNAPAGIVYHPTTGDMYVADGKNNVIRKITPDGVVSTYAGAGGVGAFMDGTIATARFFTPVALAWDNAGNLVVVDRDNRRIRLISPAGAVSTLAGSGAVGCNNFVYGTSASFTAPSGVAVDAARGGRGSRPSTRQREQQHRSGCCRAARRARHRGALRAATGTARRGRRKKTNRQQRKRRSLSQHQLPMSRKSRAHGTGAA